MEIFVIQYFKKNIIFIGCIMILSLGSTIIYLTNPFTVACLGYFHF